MTNREKLECYCRDNSIELKILTYDEIVKDYVGDVGIDTVEDFTGWEMDQGDLAYWIVGSEPYFIIVNKDSDISSEEFNRALLFLGD